MSKMIWLREGLAEAELPGEMGRASRVKGWGSLGWGEGWGVGGGRE